MNIDMIKNLPQIKKLFALFLLAWIIVCGFMALITYYSHDLFKPDRIDRESFGDTHNKNKDFLEFKLSEVRHGDFFGTIELIIRNEKTKQLYSKSHSVYIFITGSASGLRLSIPRWIRLTESENIGDNIILRTSDLVEFYAFGRDHNFPYEKYHIDIIPEIQFIINDRTNTVDITPDSASTLINLNHSYAVQSVKEIPNKSCDYTDCNRMTFGPLDKNQFYFIVQRQPWFKWIVLCVIGILFIPVLLMLGAKLSTMNIDIIAILISIATIRSYMLGVTTNIYNIDLIFGIILLSMAIIPLFKILHDKRNNPLSK